ncbi:arylesterase [Pedobacter sp. KLB.chiD]|uniref:arylesterase n=1 Tax=Pedobacter sp. KLB.chiD TaxID=3387402 RepID=UPI0039998E6D
MLRKRLMGLFVLSLILFSCGNRQSKNDNDKTLDSTDQKKTAVVTERKNILFFGTSLTAGYGLDPTEAYPALIQNRIDSLKMPYNVINGGLSGETSAGGKSRIDWLLKQRVDIFVLELGANDGLRGLPVAQTVKNLQAIIDRVKAKYPDAKMVLAGMQVPPNMGAKYAADFKNMFPELAKKNNMALIPFLLDKVGGVPKLNQADGIHPTAEGDKILAENVWVVLKDLL